MESFMIYTTNPDGWIDVACCQTLQEKKMASDEFSCFDVVMDLGSFQRDDSRMVVIHVEA